MSSIPKDKFAPFIVTTHIYKTVDEHPIPLDVFIPRKLIEAGPDSEEWKTKRPVMLFFHGGWLIGGQRDFQPWWSQWVLDIVNKHGAIGITADHRLIPEATCEDVLDDIHDVWEWMAKDLSKVIQKEHLSLEPNISKVFLSGCSAGGYCAIQLGLTFFKSGSDAVSSSVPIPRVILALYPYVSVRTPHWTQAYEKNIFGTPQLPNSLLDDHIASIAAIQARTGKRPILTSIPMLNLDGKFSERGLFAVCAEQHGRIVELLGTERDSSPEKRRMFPEDRIIDGCTLPPIALVHGVDDTISPVEGTDLFVEHLKKYKGVKGMSEGKEDAEVLKYYKVPGEHLLDTELTLEGGTDEWVKDAEVFITKHWLG